MTRIVRLPEVEKALASVDLVAAMERAFVAYSSGRAVIPPVGELLFDDPGGEVHIKYGYIRGDDHFVIKVASGFYDNAANGLPSSSGLMLLFDARTGAPSAILLEEGHLTNVRTAAAGAVAAKHLAPSKVERIGICGTGVQARLQLHHLKDVTDCRDVLLWGRSAEKVEEYRSEMGDHGFKIEAANSPAEVARSCNLIVTATLASEPLLTAADVRPGTHITAMGSDTPSKNELDPAILSAADLVVADSISQCRERGEIHHALGRGAIDPAGLSELGEIVEGTKPGRLDDGQVTICDLTGVAVQDIEICKAVLSGLAPDAGEAAIGN